ncbi:hypothetical protein SAMN04488003_1584 [Loktanella fryxellensis]|uniref:Ribbon-helix-helix protein, copG family n=1 Tax=Loktanella fryxellensis TaxID=245187 RepID=A0A1H8K9N3_9RHOB|nr:hypothetical protein [Loktanella fryxellensis]SEN89709.1 hypothetical protein SAMN04488003_1584 [Loktanella fryxellensis]
MPQKTISYTIRQAPEVARQIDDLAKRHGFPTRAKFMSYAALTYGGGGDAAIVAELSQISYALHQIDRAATERLHLLKPNDIDEIGRRARAALNSVIFRNAG